MDRDYNGRDVPAMSWREEGTPLFRQSTVANRGKIIAREIARSDKHEY
jgi:hypothetical protein